MMKYKVGDKVKIRKGLSCGDMYKGFFVAQKMSELGGRIARVTEVCEHDRAYHLNLLPNIYWTDEMFENVDTEVQGMNKHVGVYINGNKVIAVSLKTGKQGTARCHPDDDFDFYVGAKIALERLEEAEKPYAWLNVGKTYYSPAPGTSRLYNSATYMADGYDKRAMERGLAFQTKEEAIACAKKMLAAVKQEG